MLVNRQPGLFVAIVTLVALLTGCGSSSQRDMTAAQIVTKLRQAGLPITKQIVYDETTDPNGRMGRPGQYVSKVNFHDPRVPTTDPEEPGNGGSVETFTDTGDAKRWYDATHSFAVNLSGEYVYRDGKRVLRLSSGLTPAQAKRYETAFENLG